MPHLLKPLPDDIHELLIGRKPSKGPKFIDPTLETVVDDFDETAFNPLRPYLGNVDDLLEKYSQPAVEVMAQMDDFFSYSIPDPDALDLSILTPGKWHLVSSDRLPQPIELEDLPHLVIMDDETVEYNARKARAAICSCALGMYQGEMRFFVWIAKYIMTPRDEEIFVPFPQTPRIVMNQSALYDRSYTESSYQLIEPHTWIDIMSMARATVAVSNKQKPLWLKLKKAPKRPEWVDRCTATDLKSLAANIGIEVDKGTRKDIIKEKWSEWPLRIDEYLRYCVQDVWATFFVGQAYFPIAKGFLPSPVTWMGFMRIAQNKLYVPNWNQYISNAEAAYNTADRAIDDVLMGICVEMAANPTEETASQLDWRGQKSPKWFRDLKGSATFTKRAVVVALQLELDGHPIRWHTDDLGESYWVQLKPEGVVRIANILSPDKGLQTPISKGYAAHIASGRLTSRIAPQLPMLFQLKESCGNWVQLRKRIYGQTPCNNFIIPRSAPMGTQSCRTTDPVWLVVANALTSRIGTELMGFIEAPEDYVVVWADYDGQEGWLAGLEGDLYYAKGRQPIAGSTRLSYAVLNGDKDKGTDFHTQNSKNAGVPRQTAKIAAFLILYGGSKKALQAVMTAGLPAGSSMKEIELACQRMIAAFKGTRTNNLWSGGLASDTFNQLDRISKEPHVRSPALKKLAPDALNPLYQGGRDGSTANTLKNWRIQSSGVDIMHIFLTLTLGIAKDRGLRVTQCLQQHDAMIFYAHRHDAEEFRTIMQACHLMSKAVVYEAMNFRYIPCRSSLFEGVDIDVRLRKAPYAGCYTPSNQKGFPAAEWKDGEFTFKEADKPKDWESNQELLEVLAGELLGDLCAEEMSDLVAA